MQKTNEHGRTTLEMLGVLVIIGVLSIGGIIGYRQAMDKHRVNEMLFIAQQYASSIFTGKKTNPDKFGIPHLPTLSELGFKTERADLYPTNSFLKENGVELHISFFSADQCRIAASLLNESCRLVSLGNPCREANTGLSSADRAQIEGCFDHIFETR